MADNENSSPASADNEFGSPAPVNTEASETAAAIAAGVPLEDQDKDLMEEAYEATQREVEADIHGQKPEAEASGEQDYGQFNSREELLESYENLRNKVGELGLTPESYMNATGERANENQELRERLARLEGQAQAMQAPRQASPAMAPRHDPRLQSRQMFANQRTQTYIDQGFGEVQAREIASKDAVALGMFVDAEITNRVDKYDRQHAANEKERQVQVSARSMREEKDRAGNLVRPHWDNVVKTQEFEDQARNLGSSFYTKDGLELAYLRTLPQIESVLEQESSSAVEEARANASNSKRRASVGPAATPASKTPTTRSSDDAEIEAIYESARAGKKSKNVFDGGAFD